MFGVYPNLKTVAVAMFNEYLSENLYVIHPAMVGVNLSGARIQFGNRNQWFEIKWTVLMAAWLDPT